MSQALPILGESDADRSVLARRTVGILGYGNQGRAHAANLRDGGVKVVVGARPGGEAERSAQIGRAHV